MGSEWVQLRDIVSIKGGKRLPKGESLQVDPNSHPYIRVRDMGSKYIPREGLEFVPDTVFPKIKNYIVNENDVIISIVGTVGLVAVIDSFFDSASQTENCAKLSGLDALDAQYLYYCLVSPLGQREIAVQTVGAVQPKLPLYGIENITIPWPLRSIRESIVGCLGGLDNKIALNRQINTTLESMAQALFKSWFVDFDPVIDNALAAGNEIPDELAARAARREALHQQTNKTANKTTGATDADSPEQALPDTGLSDQRLPSEIQQLFPDRFVLTEEMGWVPEGWEVKPLSEALYINPKVSIKKGAEATYVDMKALPTSGFMIDEAIKKEFAGGAKFKNRDVLLARITPCLENGKTGLVDFLSDDEAGFGSTEFIVLREKGSITMPFIAALSRHPEFRNHCVLNMVGSSGRQRVQNSCFDSYFVSTPTDSELLELFDQVCYPYFTKMAKCRDEALNLADLRDSLLPKLLSGQITIPDAEQQLAEVL